MTEDEARMKRCCGPSDCGRRDNNSYAPELRWCVASQCMAWKNIGTIMPVHGYCDLAGKPDAGKESDRREGIER
jgi:hypothetical protein